MTSSSLDCIYKDLLSKSGHTHRCALGGQDVGLCFGWHTTQPIAVAIAFLTLSSRFPAFCPVSSNLILMVADLPEFLHLITSPSLPFALDVRPQIPSNHTELVVLTAKSGGGKPRRALFTDTQSAPPRGGVTVTSHPPPSSLVPSVLEEGPGPSSPLPAEWRALARLPGLTPRAGGQFTALFTDQPRPGAAACVPAAILPP